MIRSFETTIASVLGINEAILLHNLYFWINRNAANEEHFHDGRYWTYNTIQAIAKQVVCLSEDQVRRALNKLTDKNFLIKGNYNTSNINRTLWYAFSDTAISVMADNGYDMTNIATDLANLPNGSGENAKSYNTDSNITDIKNNDKDKSLSKKDDSFEECWKKYRRKGSKKSALAQWKKLSEDDKTKVVNHIPHYVSSRELSYQKDFERYLRDRIFETPVYKNNSLVFDPDSLSDTNYHPYGNNGIFWSDDLKAYVVVGDMRFDIFDGYTNENRPNGARIFNQGRYYAWSSKMSKWVVEE